MSDVILEMKNITKEFPGVKALDDVNLVVKRGSIHALVGENGAGISKERLEKAGYTFFLDYYLNVTA